MTLHLQSKQSQGSRGFASARPNSTDEGLVRSHDAHVESRVCQKGGVRRLDVQIRADPCRAYRGDAWGIRCLPAGSAKMHARSSGRLRANSARSLATLDRFKFRIVNV